MLLPQNNTELGSAGECNSGSGGGGRGGSWLAARGYAVLLLRATTAQRLRRVSRGLSGAAVSGAVAREALLLNRRLPGLRLAHGAGLRTRRAEAGVAAAVLRLVSAQRHRRAVRHRHRFEAAGKTERGAVTARGLRGMPTDGVRLAS